MEQVPLSPSWARGIPGASQAWQERCQQHPHRARISLSALPPGCTVSDPCPLPRGQTHLGAPRGAGAWRSSLRGGGGVGDRWGHPAASCPLGPPHLPTLAGSAVARRDGRGSWQDHSSAGASLPIPSDTGASRRPFFAPGLAKSEDTVASMCPCPPGGASRVPHSSPCRVSGAPPGWPGWGHRQPPTSWAPSERRGASAEPSQRRGEVGAAASAAISGRARPPVGAGTPKGVPEPSCLAKGPPILSLPDTPPPFTPPAPMGRTPTPQCRVSPSQPPPPWVPPRPRAVPWGGRGGGAVYNREPGFGE